MRPALSFPSTLVSVLTIVVMLLTLRTASAGTNPDGSCVNLVRQNADGIAVTIGPNCDLREVARRFPQLDSETGKALPTQVQLRSIFAENERRAQGNGRALSPVRRGCVRSRVVPEGTSAEEREACPTGLVNYFGVASIGSQQSIIWVPKTRVPSQAERLETLSRSACSAIASVEKLSDSLPASRRAAIAKAASDCRTTMPDAIPTAPDSAEASTEPQPPSVTALTQQLDDSRAKVARLETRLQAKDTESALLAPKLQTSRWVPALLGALFLLLCGNGIQALLHFRQRRATRAQRQVLVDRDRLARALRAMEDEFDSRVAAIREEKDSAIEQMRLSTAQLEVELLETAASQAEAHRESEEQRWSRALEESEEDVSQRLQQALNEARAQSDNAMAELAAAKEEISRLVTDLHALQQESAQNLRRATSLQNRLQMARSRNAYLEAGSGPDPESHTSQAPEMISATGV